MHPISDIITKCHPFLDTLFAHLENDKINVSGYELDHVCYRVETIEEYEMMRREFEKIGKIVKGEQIIGGRPIATYKLDKPIRYHEREIGLIELPSPKSGSAYRTGWEHAEFVVDTSLEDFMTRYSLLDWNTHSLSKEINPDVSRKYIDCIVKFHQRDLEYVIQYLQ